MKHGLSGHRLYGMYNNMIYRCYKPKCKHFKWYGARGIGICDEWRNDFVSFYNWAIRNGWVAGLSIERENVNGWYCPENCKFIPMVDQYNNKVKEDRVGERNPNAKLTNDQVIEINSLKGKVRICDLAEKYSIHSTTISDIWSGRRWVKFLNQLP